MSHLGANLFVDLLANILVHVLVDGAVLVPAVVPFLVFALSLRPGPAQLPAGNSYEICIGKNIHLGIQMNVSRHG